MGILPELESQFDPNVVFEPTEFKPVKFDCICRTVQLNLQAISRTFQFNSAFPIEISDAIIFSFSLFLTCFFMISNGRNNLLRRLTEIETE